MNSDQHSESIRLLVEAAADAAEVLSAKSGLPLEFAHIRSPCRRPDRRRGKFWDGLTQMRVQPAT
jgi:hypothetical protein